MNSQTTFTQVTPSGRAAITTIVVRGPNAINVVADFFESASKKILAAGTINKILFGKWQAPLTVAEDLVVCLREINVVEIHCHGGTAACESISACLQSRGCVKTSWQHQTSNYYGGSAYCQDVWELVPLTTTRVTTQIALRHATGEIDRLLDDVRHEISSGKLASAAELLQPYICTYKLGRHIIDPFVVVIAGRPNAGKSSLLNAMTGVNRSIVNQQAGTTRDVLQYKTMIRGWAISFWDTAGIRTDAQTLEQLGVAKAEQAVATADLVIWVHDVTENWQSQVEQVERELDDINYLIVINKTDIQQAGDDLPSQIAVSAKTGEGIDELSEKIIERLMGGGEDQQTRPMLLTKSMDDSFKQWFGQLKANEIPTDLLPIGPPDHS
ncbi:MAG: GTP-binding protein [Planctomycetaceae bacterium]|nr:GTP-binding protein [Planctomycetaceae bacterium]MBT4726118.1 GTP-binding protein [Planctomycetaceae bacterium]MBT4846185.1 GTP-binding protein [Planctomycetaceae bacterium]MBT5126573.1 GTP-binding protein [Planctomycetaceae bacterium]MBT5597749.1 GTP-binding protein [Planctomycetaceae bacterium]